MIIFMIFPSYKAECISYENIIEDVLKYRGNVSEYAGSTDGDWCAFVYGRYYGDNSDYLHNLSENVYQRYQTEQKLSRSKSTEWHRIILTVLACGGDPFDVRGINLLEDGVYNRGKQFHWADRDLTDGYGDLYRLTLQKQIYRTEAFIREKILYWKYLNSKMVTAGFLYMEKQAIRI